MDIWHASIGFTAKPMSEDNIFDTLDELAEYGAAMGISSDYTSAHVTMTIRAADPISAAKKALNVIGNVQAIEKVSVEDVRVVTPERFDAENAKPIFPPVVGYAEIAQMIGVSRQRARQLSNTPKFPHPVIETAQGPLYNQRAIELWAETRRTKPGRPALAAV